MTHHSCPQGKWVSAINVRCADGQPHTIDCCSVCLTTSRGDTVDARFRFLEMSGKKPAWHPDFRKLACANEHAAKILLPYLGKTRVRPASVAQQLA